MIQDFRKKSQVDRAKGSLRCKIIFFLVLFLLAMGVAAACAKEPWDALPGLAVLLALFCLARMADRPIFFVVRVLALGLALASIALIQTVIPSDATIGTPYTMLRTLWHGLAAAVFVLGLRLLVPWRRLSLVLFALLYALLTAAMLFFWGYFFAARRWASGDTFVAIYQTNPAEAAAYWGGHMGLLGTLALVLLLVVAVCFGRWLARVLARADLPRPRRWLGIFALVLAFAPVFFLCAPHDGSYYGRIGSEGVFAIRSLRAFRAHHALHAGELADVKRIAPQSGGIHILVLGESQNKTYMHAYGYDAETTPWLDRMKNTDACIFFQHAYSNHTYTVPALTYALTEKNQYNDVDETDALSLLEVAKAAGYRTAWISNQGKNGISDTPMSVLANDADDVRFLNEHQYLDIAASYDEALVPVLDDVLAQLGDDADALIVVHLMGCHAFYDARYPSDFAGAVFDASTDVGAYENATRYNDAVMQEIYAHAKKAAGFRDLIYFSDHGESPATGHQHDPDLYEPCMTYIPFYILKLRR